MNIGQKSIMHGTSTTQFKCGNCSALYHLIKVEAGPETVDRKLHCQACDAPLPVRDGQLVLKLLSVAKAEPTLALTLHRVISVAKSVVLLQRVALLRQRSTVRSKFSLSLVGADESAAHA